MSADSLVRTMYVEKTGNPSGSPVILLHGWGASAHLMRPVAAALAPDFSIHNIDLPGHGRTPPPPIAIGVPEFATLVHCYIRYQNLEKVTLIGHSNGGRIALFMASDDVMRSSVLRLILISPSGIRGRPSLKVSAKRILVQMLKAPFQVLPSKARETGLDWLRHTALWQALASSDYRTLGGVMRETFVKVVNYHLDDRIHTISVPTLLFWGDKDRDISRRQIETLEQKIPDAGLVVLEGAGHYGYLDQPEVFEAAAKYFLDHS